VFDNAYTLRRKLAASGVMISDARSQIVSVLLGDNDRAVVVASRLQAEGFDVRAIRPPTVPPGTARLRVSVNPGRTAEVIDRFVMALVEALEACSAGPVRLAEQV